MIDSEWCNNVKQVDIIRDRNSANFSTSSRESDLFKLLDIIYSAVPWMLTSYILDYRTVKVTCPTTLLFVYLFISLAQLYRALIID